MIERYLYTAIENGIAKIVADPALIDLIFEELDLVTAEIDKVKALWVAKPPKVKHSYTRLDDPLPIYSIVLANERETQMFIGDDVGQVLDEEDILLGADIKGAVWEHSHQVHVLTRHPDHTLYNYEILKSIMLRANLLSVPNIHSTRLSGADLQLGPEWAPEPIFARQLTIATQRLLESIDPGTRLGKAFSVSGIHVDSSGSSSSVGDVETLVTISEA